MCVFWPLCNWKPELTVTIANSVQSDTIWPILLSLQSSHLFICMLAHILLDLLCVWVCVCVKFLICLYFSLKKYFVFVIVIAVVVVGYKKFFLNMLLRCLQHPGLLCHLSFVLSKCNKRKVKEWSNKKKNPFFFLFCLVNVLAVFKFQYVCACVHLTI